MEQAATLAHEKETLTQQYAQASALAQALQAQEHAWQTERATLMNHARSLEDAQRELTLSLSREKQDHALTQARFSAFQQQQEHEATAQRQRDTQQMEKVYLQLQRSLTSLQVLQEHVVDEELTKQQVESATRLRMITSLESSSRQCARQTEEECQRLSSLLGALESTLRHARQEQLDERERLRQEQHRLTALAAHFQAQTSVLHEKSDANAQMLTQYFATSMQDTRMAEARVFQRRQALEDEERKLYDERARFAAYREETLREQQREQTKLQQERERLDTQWQRLRQERDDLDEVIASHEDEFAELQRAHQALQDEKASIALGAEQVAAMAAKCEALTQQLVAREEALKQQQEALNAVRQQAQTKDERLRQDKHKLDERETRLHTQVMSDPSGLSPAMRQLVEENWKKRSWDLGLADAAVHKERMLINCLGLDKPVAPTPSTTASTMPSTSKPWERHHGKTSNSRAQYSATKASNWMPTSSQRTSPPSPSPPSVSSSQPTAPPAPPRAAPLAAPSALRRPSPVVSIEL
ncbi:TPA: hypothetical protein N0F65_000291 [Lagenidium giganteum]|uniref:Uncharacterized protein n=1 Tax=Lagenidium giganteum TaxID=4803 RepID=A0AAV2Z937_9STRA|nr:TPA: hypothetical protein N0F65_000291 [Lagenidium giganteum]